MIAIRVLVTGSRQCTDEQWVKNGILNEIPSAHKLVLIHGGAPGVDSLAVSAMRSLRSHIAITEIVEYPADWKTHGRAAGPIRNQQMLDEGRPDIVIAFPLKGSKGTWNMIHKANDAGVKVVIVPKCARKRYAVHSGRWWDE